MWQASRITCGAQPARKASAQRPWEGGRALGPTEDPWPTVGASARAMHGFEHVANSDPEKVLTVQDGMIRVVTGQVGRVGDLWLR